MADNYLERKMEELRSGKIGTTPTRHYAVKRNQLVYPYKTLRVLIASDQRRFLRQYADVFRIHEGRIAIFNTCPESETDLGDSHGCRYQEISIADYEDAFSNLIKAWRDIDVVIMLDPIPGLQALLCKHVESVPYPNEWGMPVLEVGNGILTRHSTPDYIPHPSSAKDIPDNPAARQLPYLSLPQNSDISQIVLQQ